MPSVKNLQRKAFHQQATESYEKKIREEELKKVMGFSCMLLVLDNYVLKRDDFKISFTAYKNMFSQTFEAEHIYDLIEPVGQWMCGLNKGVWEINKAVASWVGLPMQRTFKNKIYEAITD